MVREIDVVEFAKIHEFYAVMHSCRNVFYKTLFFDIILNDSRLNVYNLKSRGVY